MSAVHTEYNFYRDDRVPTLLNELLDQEWGGGGGSK